jgi:hypothetical protein
VEPEDQRLLGEQLDDRQRPAIHGGSVATPRREGQRGGRTRDTVRLRHKRGDDDARPEPSHLRRDPGVVSTYDRDDRVPVGDDGDPTATAGGRPRFEV